jgi:hypothetical protein
VRRLEAWRCVRRGRKRASYLLGLKVELRVLGFRIFLYWIWGSGSGVWDLGFTVLS